MTKRSSKSGDGAASGPDDRANAIENEGCENANDVHWSENGNGVDDGCCCSGGCAYAIEPKTVSNDGEMKTSAAQHCCKMSAARHGILPDCSVGFHPLHHFDEHHSCQCENRQRDEHSQPRSDPNRREIHPGTGSGHDAIRIG